MRWEHTVAVSPELAKRLREDPVALEHFRQMVEDRLNRAAAKMVEDSVEKTIYGDGASGCDGLVGGGTDG